MLREKPKWRSHEGLSTDARHRGGWARSSVEVPVMGRERRGPITPSRRGVNPARGRNSPTGRSRDPHRVVEGSTRKGRNCSTARRGSLRLRPGDKSRMSREAPVRFCEGPGVRFPRATRLVVLARSRRQLERVVLPRLREFLAARGLRLSDEKTRIVRDTQGFDFVGRHFQRLTPTKFLVRPRRSSIRAHLDTLSQLFRNRALPVGVKSQKANAISRGCCNHYLADHSYRVFQRLTYWTLRSFCK